MPDQRPRIHILATGGTIAGQSQDGHGYQAGQLSVEQIIHSLPATLADKAALSAEQLSNVGSQSIDAAIWRRLLDRTRAVQDDDIADALVITHGTDTMEETAWLMALLCGRTIPIVLTGAMRPSDALGADGPANLAAAIALAGDPRAKAYGPLVVMNDRLHLAQHVQKMCANGIEAFASPNRGPAGAVHATNVVFHAAPQAEPPAWNALRKRLKGSFPQAPAKVYVLFAHADMDIELVDHLLALRPAGLVVAGVGNGNLPETIAARLADAVSEGLMVVRSSRTAVGDVRRNVEVDDDRFGFLAGRTFSPQKARILLSLGLTAFGPQHTTLQDLFDA